MSAQTEIAWCDSTFNPWIGCTKVGPGCDHCYAERDMDQRRHRVKWGAGQERSRTSADYWKQPLRWNRLPYYECSGCGWRGDRLLYLNALDCPTCGAMVASARRRVFCASLADVFDNEVPASWRDDLFSLIRATPNLDWLLLTKRIGNAERMISEAGGWLGIGADGSRRNPLPNVWIGATVVNQAEVDRDVPKLLATPAAVRFLSIEPMLGPISFEGMFASTDYRDGTNMLEEIDWIVAGGESGHGARPMHPAWVRDLRDQCAACSVPFLFKQWGEWAPAGWPRDGAVDLITETKLSDPPGDGAMRRLGKKRSGRLLDGVLHHAFPRAA